jgi:hypothetical protein
MIIRMTATTAQLAKWEHLLTAVKGNGHDPVIVHTLIDEALPILLAEVHQLKMDLQTEMGRANSWQEETYKQNDIANKFQRTLTEIASRQCPRDARSGDCPDSELCYTEWCGGCIARKTLEKL